MATVKVKNLKQVQSSIRKLITKELRSKEIRKEVGEFVVSDIRNKTFRRVSPDEPYFKFRS